MLPLTLDPFEQVKHSHSQSIRNNLNRIQRRVGLAILNSAEVGLVEPTLFAKHHLAHARLQPQRANAQAETLSKGVFHTQNYVVYALIHINTNSYKAEAIHGVDHWHLFGRWLVQGMGQIGCRRARSTTLDVQPEEPLALGALLLYLRSDMAFSGNQKMTYLLGALGVIFCIALVIRGYFWPLLLGGLVGSFFGLAGFGGAVSGMIPGAVIGGVIAIAFKQGKSD